jgi:hypothetical protein
MNGCGNFPECSCEHDGQCWETRRRLGCMPLLILAIVAWVAIGFVFSWVTGAVAHEATTVQGHHLGINYPPGCCSSAITNPTTGDCSPIDDRYVKEGPDGYEIDLPVGAHPKLKKRGYKGVVPYSAARQPLSNDFHICLATDGANRFCFFPKPGAV